MKNKIFKIVGKVQHYAWGGFNYIPQLLNIDNSEHKTYAEYWLGSHPSASSVLLTEEGPKSWAEQISLHPEFHLGSEVFKRFGELPFLLKVLDVREMLSIQVHPSKEGAEIGFDEEEAIGVPINAPYRNYKDRNHKPEMMIALDEFWLLHGFRKEADITNVLETVEEFESLKSVFKTEGYFGLYKTVMEMPQKAVDELLLPLVKRELTITSAKNEPTYWVNKLYSGQLPSGNIDKGLFSIYFFNIVKLNKGEGIFQGAGLPHAYLEGQNIELMANSDNVLRGGLTPKHIDVNELLKHIDFIGIEPEILEGKQLPDGAVNFTMNVEDFAICVLPFSKGDVYTSESNSTEVFLVMKGEVCCKDINCKKGEAFAILADTPYVITFVDDSIVYKAFIPLVIKR